MARYTHVTYRLFFLKLSTDFFLILFSSLYRKKSECLLGTYCLLRYFFHFVIDVLVFKKLSVYLNEIKCSFKKQSVR